MINYVFALNGLNYKAIKMILSNRMLAGGGLWPVVPLSVETHAAEIVEVNKPAAQLGRECYSLTTCHVHLQEKICLPAFRGRCGETPVQQSSCFFQPCFAHNLRHGDNRVAFVFLDWRQVDQRYAHTLPVSIVWRLGHAMRSFNVRGMVGLNVFSNPETGKKL